MAIGRKTDAVSLNGSDVMVGMEILHAGLTTGQTFLMPIIQTSDLGEEEAQENIPTENGTNITVPGASTGTLTVTVVQKDFETINFVKDYKNKTLAFVKPVSELPLDGYFVFNLIPNVKPSQTRNIVGDSATFDIAFNVSPTASQMIVDVSNFADSNFPVALSGTVTVEKGEFFKTFKVPVA